MSTNSFKMSKEIEAFFIDMQKVFDESYRILKHAGRCCYVIGDTKLKKVEILGEHHLQKYIKLFKDLDFPHKPEVLGIAIVDFDEKGKVLFADLNDLELSPNTIKIINDAFSVGVFIRRIIALCNLKS